MICSVLLANVRYQKLLMLQQSTANELVDELWRLGFVTSVASCPRLQEEQVLDQL